MSKINLTVPIRMQSTFIANNIFPYSSCLDWSRTSWFQSSPSYQPLSFSMVSTTLKSFKDSKPNKEFVHGNNFHVWWFQQYSTFPRLIICWVYCLYIRGLSHGLKPCTLSLVFTIDQRFVWAILGLFSAGLALLLKGKKVKD